MKIAFIVSVFPTLSETFILNQIAGLLDLGCEVEIFAGFNPKEKKVHSDVEKYRLMEGVRYFNVPRNKIIRILKAIYLIITNFHKSPLKILKSLNIFRYGKAALSLRVLYEVIPFLDKRFDIIQCHFGPNGNIGAHLKQLGIKGKLVTMFHGCDIRLVVEKGENIYRQLFESGDCFLAISDYSYNNLINFGVDSQKIVFHPVGIDLDMFAYRWQSAEVGRLDSIILLTVARLVEEKGLQYGIRAIGKLLERNYRLHPEYHIIGEGPLEEKLRRLVEELNLGKIVHFLGAMRQEEVTREMQQAHIFLFPSIAEALPVVLMEAQAVGLPVISTYHSGIPEIVIDGKSGFLVPEKDIDALAEKIEYLIEHPEIWLEMGKCGRKFVEGKYDIKKLNKILLGIYQDLLRD